MYKNSFKIATTLLICVFFWAETFCFASGDQEQSAAADGPQKMLTTYATMANDFFLTFDQGAKEATEALGNEYISATDDRKPEKFISNMSSYAASDVKMMSGYSPTIGSVIEATKLVNREKVFYSNVLEIADWWTPLDAGPYWGMFHFPDARAIGMQGGDVMAEAVGEKGKTLLLLGFPGSKAGNDRGLGYKIALENYPGMEVLAEEYGDFTRDKGYSVTADWIIKYGDTIDGIYCTNTSMAVGAAVACKEAGLTDVKIIGTDANKENMKYLKDGSLYGICGIFGPWLAGHAAVVAYDMYNGWEPTVAETMMSTGFIMLTQDNADWYIDTFCGDNLPYDWKKMSRTLNPDNWDPQNLMVPINPNTFSNWEFVEKPKGYDVPEEYAMALAAGEYKEIRQLYLDHFKDHTTVPPSSSAPYDKVFASNNINDETVVDSVVK
ncbi:MAG: sugar ABC transporter substrate-binding protein [Spirochaetales bacterium]|nr:sugar ABC transporter substrate-binding protein [Spirochaetales bacterium]